MKRFLSLVIACAIPLLTLLFQQQHSDRNYGEVAAAPAQQTTEDVSLYAPIITKGFTPPPLSHFGVQTYGSTELSNQYHPYLIGSQASWVRNSIIWRTVEPNDVEPVDYNWDPADAAVAIATPRKGGLNLVVTIESMPLWASYTGDAPNGRIHPDALADFAEFLHATVERYDGDGFQDAPGRPIVRHWELFNEPDGLDNRWGGYGTEYAQMLEVAYGAIKSADPNAQVLLGGIAYDWFDTEAEEGQFDPDFLDDILKAGGGAYFDIMNFHTYPVFAPHWDSKSTGLIEKTAAIRAKLASYGLDKPVVITESGWHNGTDTVPPSSDAAQVARLVQLFTQSAAADIDILIWFMISDPGNFVPPYGLVTSDNPPQPKQAYTAYKTAVDQLGSADFVRQIGPSETGVDDMEAFEFSKDGAALYVAWINPFGTGAIQPLRIPGVEATLISGTGELIPPGPVNANPVSDDDGDGYLEVNIRSQPMYIQVTLP